MRANWTAVVLAIVSAELVFAQAAADRSSQFNAPPLAQFGGEQPGQPQPDQPGQPQPEQPQPEQPQPGQPGQPQPGQPGQPQPGQPGQPQPGQFGGPGPQGFMGPPPNLMFSAIDVDGDGVITKAELRRARVQLLKLDADKDGNITLAEVSPFGPMGPAPNPAQFVENIMGHDRNRDGRLTADEVPDNLKPMLRDADLNNDSAVTREELAQVMQNMQNRFPGGPGAGPWNRPGAFPGQRGFGNQNNEATQMTGRLLRGDRDGDGKLSAEELPENMRGMFKKGDDLDGDGSLDAAEVQAALERLGDRARGLRGGIDPEEMRDRARGNRRGRDRAPDDE